MFCIRDDEGVLILLAVFHDGQDSLDSLFNQGDFLAGQIEELLVQRTVLELVVENIVRSEMHSPLEEVESVHILGELDKLPQLLDICLGEWLEGERLDVLHKDFFGKILPKAFIVETVLVEEILEPILSLIGPDKSIEIKESSEFDRNVVVLAILVLGKIQGLEVLLGITLVKTIVWLGPQVLCHVKRHQIKPLTSQLPGDFPRILQVPSTQKLLPKALLD